MTRDERALAGEFSELNPQLKLPAIEPRSNIAPSQDVLALAMEEGSIQARLLHWGITLPWEQHGRRRDLINVRAETARRGGWFRKLLGKQRILLPASWVLRVAQSRRRPPAHADRPAGWWALRLNEVGCLCWNELTVPAFSALERFDADLFEWRVVRVPTPEGSPMITGIANRAGWRNGNVWGCPICRPPGRPPGVAPTWPAAAPET